MPQSERKKIDFNPNPIQKNFIESQAHADLFSSRVGEGKSTALVWSCFYHTRHNPGADWAFIRDTFENIQKSTQKTFFQWFPPGVFGTYNTTKKQFTWAEGIASGTVTFVGMDDPGDASKLLSWELGGIAMDEPAPAAGSAGIDEMVFDLGVQRLRQPGMKWYAMKLATNNPDDNHWTYKKFVEEGQEQDYRLWQPNKPENMQNLPEGYYERLRRQLQHRPDLVRRFIDGEFGFQQEGEPVTPQWSDRIHLTMGLVPLRLREIVLCWDFGHNPTCIITQRTPQGYWNSLYSFVGDGIGVEELIIDQVAPILRDKFMGCPIRHIGDPAGNQREQTSITRTAVQAIKRLIGGTWRSGPQRWEERINPAQTILTRTIQGTGLVQVDRINAKELWHALRGGWHYHKSRTGVVSAEAFKNMSSHPGDAWSYGAAILFPSGKLYEQIGRAGTQPIGSKPGHYFGNNQDAGPIFQPLAPVTFTKGPRKMPSDGAILQPGRGGKGYF